jgi:dephospho-CoA kinase
MRVAITGGIAEGKSTVLRILAELGYPVSSADAIARDLFLDPALNTRLAEVAGVPAPISPAALRAALASTEVRRNVNRIMHAPVMERLEEEAAQFVEVPLLLEACLQSRFDRVWVVTCGEEEQRRRLQERYGSEADLIALVASQLPSRAKIPFADLVVRTNQPLENVRRLMSEAASAMSGG